MDTTLPHAPSSFPVHAWTRPARGAGAVLQALAVCGLLLVAWALVRSTVQGVPLPPLQLTAWLLLYAVLPAGLALLLRVAGAGRVEVHADRLVLRVRGSTWELPAGALSAVRPWRVPLPGPGFSLRLTAGRPFRYGLQAEDPTPLLAALARVHPAAAAAVEHPSTRFAHARAAAMRHRLLRLGLKYGLFPLAPTLLLFRAHQYIAYGGLLGEYQLHGLGAYLRTLLATWLDVTAHLLLWAALWRVAVEAVSLLSAWGTPARARGVRRLAEGASGLAYYVGVPALVAFIFLR